MVKRMAWKTPFLLLAFICIFWLAGASAAFAVADQHIYDNADLLNSIEAQELEAEAAKYSREEDVDFLFLTVNGMEGKDIVTFMGDFFDQWAVDNSQENAVLLTIDIASREVFLSGFGTAETSLDDERIDLVLDRIVPDLQAGDYGGAFEETMAASSEYMDYRPGVNPESIFLKTWFHALVALILGGGIVGSMLYNSGGRVTTTPRTYFDGKNTQVTNREDRFRNKTVSRTKVQQNKGSGGGFGGGGMTGGGRSFSGGGRKF
ncbi:uncharacterized protein HNQ44_001294 [Planomicrobium koreense]|uniref:TPM domain-containing protein n=1 Tax=Planococcus koreensis TaxID=112331 RepID=A0A7W8CTU1_9BACL|nr:TPM domain-containing protein [Planococcus koreensis]MBB5179870.1 uncharacterized protein [Planococcus koreensis]